MTEWDSGCELTLGLEASDPQGVVLARGLVRLLREVGTFTFTNPDRTIIDVKREGLPFAYRYFDPMRADFPTIYECSTKPDLPKVLPDDALRFEPRKLSLTVEAKRRGSLHFLQLPFRPLRDL